MESLGEDVSTIAERGELRTIVGIGPSLADKIDEYLKTGAVAYHRELASELPAGLATLMEIPEVGPEDRAAAVPEPRRGRRGRARARRPCRADPVAAPDGSRRPNRRFSLGIERRRRQGTRAPLGCRAAGRARDRGDARRDTGRGGPQPRRQPPADARYHRRRRHRRRDPRPGRADGAVRVAAAGAGGAAPGADAQQRPRWAAPGVQCDVRAVAPESYGAALQYFTGSKDHNVQLRELGVRLGLKINEYGVFRVDGEARIAGATEADVYGAVGLALDSARDPRGPGRDRPRAARRAAGARRGVGHPRRAAHAHDVERRQGHRGGDGAGRQGARTRVRLRHRPFPGPQVRGRRDRRRAPGARARGRRDRRPRGAARS